MYFLSKNIVMQFFVAIILFLEFNVVSGQYAPNWAQYLQANGDHHTSGSILQATGGGAQRNDGRTQQYATYNAYNNPSAYPRYNYPTYNGANFQYPRYTFPTSGGASPGFTFPTSSGASPGFGNFGTGTSGGASPGFGYFG
ncbi:hypothetical protein DdX_12167 [Ditylenchus destructor]|uniref:Uncharacterized protein n=1 Tax=Ditylenchus destructor TaxID=166010 RepID=A0AAD4R3Z1_9BILA|nr:hypothetical protein DdX_12167 [Ditylenchus destructor]